MLQMWRHTGCTTACCRAAGRARRTCSISSAALRARRRATAARSTRRRTGRGTRLHARRRARLPLLLLHARRLTEAPGGAREGRTHARTPAIRPWRASMCSRCDVLHADSSVALRSSLLFTLHVRTSPRTCHCCGSRCERVAAPRAACSRLPVQIVRASSLTAAARRRRTVVTAACKVRATRRWWCSLHARER